MNIRELSEQNLEKVLQRSLQADGKFSQEDAAAAQLFCRIVEAESGAAYPFFPNGLNKDYTGDLAAQSRSGSA